MNDATATRNRLASETSPYLLQHATNPVAWYPWCDEAIQRAEREQKPIFLSIGYSACHWCHVMEHESFEDSQIAAILNQHFVSIKVDREERPDLDQIYMTAVQLLTGRGGWPMSVFLTPALHPFFGGTYWPPEPRMGMPGFKQVLLAVLDAWQSRREQAIEQSRQITEHIQQATQIQATASTLDESLLRAAAARMEHSFDFTYGGFGSTPKFPHSMSLQALLRVPARTGSQAPIRMVQLTLDKMASGGIYDHLAGGFARYSVDERWLVPHFEKMLYDNALLTDAYLDAYLACGHDEYARIASQTLDYVLQTMTDDAGGFYSTEDADSEGVEGKFYVWTPDEIAQVLGAEQAERFCAVYDVRDEGNFEHGTSILNLPKTISQCAAIKGWDATELAAELEVSRNLLLAHRNRRIRPGRDDKVLASWNGLMIRSMARAGAVLGSEKYMQAAARAAGFIMHSMRSADGGLLHSWRHGEARLNGYLEDYACVALGLVALYEATFDEAWIDQAMALVDYVIEHFSDPDAAGFYFTSDQHRQLITRIKDMHDNATPCANAVMASVLVRLGRICSRTDYLQLAEALVRAAAQVMERASLAAGQWLLALDELLGPVRQIVLVAGDDAADEVSEILRALRRQFQPNTLVQVRDANTAYRSPHLAEAFRGRESAAEVKAYVCQGSQCDPPLIGQAQILEKLSASR